MNTENERVTNKESIEERSMEQSINWDRVESVYDWMKKEDAYLDWAGQIADNLTIDMSSYFPTDKWGNDASLLTDVVSKFYLWEPFRPPLAKNFLTRIERAIIRYCDGKALHPNVLRIIMARKSDHMPISVYGMFPEITSPDKDKDFE